MKKTIVKIVQVVIVSFAVLAMMSVPAFAAGTITIAQAKGIALKDAGLKESDVIFLKAELDKGGTEHEDREDLSAPDEDDGTGDAESTSSDTSARVPKYEIEFYYDGTLYEYDIDSDSGSIIKLEKDSEFFLNPGALPTALP